MLSRITQRQPDIKIIIMILKTTHKIQQQCYNMEPDMPPTFYNPLLAQSCSGNECVMINWGQVAMIETMHRSDLMYYSRYRNCGGGVIEYDIVAHYYGSQVPSENTYFDFMSTPWMGKSLNWFSFLLHLFLRVVFAEAKAKKWTCLTNSNTFSFLLFMHLLTFSPTPTTRDPHDVISRFVIIQPN